MSTKFFNDQWRMPRNANQNKVSNYSMVNSTSSQRIKVSGLATSLNLTDEVSVSIWWRTPSQQSNKYIFGFQGPGTANGFDLGMHGSNIGSYAAFSGSGGGGLLTSFNYYDNVWHNYILTYSGSVRKFYIDGDLIVESAASGNMSLDSIGDFYTFSTNSGNFGGIGEASDVCIFDYALSDGGVSVGQTATGQIATLYGGGSAMGNPMSLSPKPMAYYKLGDETADNGANYLVPNASLQDYVFAFAQPPNYSTPTTNTPITAPNKGSIFSNINNFSFSGWFNIPVYTLFQVFDINVGSTLYLNINMYGNDLRFNVGVFGSSGGYSYIEDLQNIVPVNTWFHFAGVFDGSGASDTDRLKLYIDGEPRTVVYGATNPTSFPTIPSNANINIGRSTTFPQTTMFSSNIQLWDSSLIPSEVQTVYNNGSPLQTLSNVPQNSNLELWWKLDASATFDGSNWSIPDDSSNSNTGTSSGMTQTNLVRSDLSFTSGYSPYALDFDGTTNYIGFPGFMSNLPSNDIYSISTWIKTTSDTDAAWGSSNSGSDLLYAYVTNGTTLGIARGSVTRVDISNLLTVGEWANVVAVFDTSTNLKIYINGVFIQNVTVGSLGAVTDDFKIGGALNAYLLACSQSNCSVWNAALTPAQVTEIHNQGAPSNLNNHSAYSNLVNWWQLGSNSDFNAATSQWIVLDEKGTSNGLSSANMANDDIINGVGYTGNGLGATTIDINSEAPYSAANSISVNMAATDRVNDVPS